MFNEIIREREFKIGVKWENLEWESARVMSSFKKHVSSISICSEKRWCSFAHSFCYTKLYRVLEWLQFFATLFESFDVIVCSFRRIINILTLQLFRLACKLANFQEPFQRTISSFTDSFGIVILANDSYIISFFCFGNFLNR